MSLLSMSVAGGLMILVTVVLRSVALSRLPKTTFLALWAVIVLRLLLPFALPSPLSAYGPLERLGGEFRAGAPFTAAQPVLNAAANHADTLAQQALPGAYAAQAGFPVNDMGAPSGWQWLWLAGACALALFFTVAYGRERRIHRESLPFENECAQAWLQQHRLRRTVRLRCSDRVCAPLTYGVFQPVILLPSNTSKAWDEQLRYVLMHEWTHIRRFDSLGKLCLIAALCVHWFNPLVWVMWVLCNRDMELSCDEAVVRACGSGARRTYAMTLIQMEEHRASLSPLCNHFSQNAIEERITAIMKIKKGTLATAMLATALVITTAVAFATSTPDSGGSAALSAIAVGSANEQTDVVSENYDARIDPKTYKENFSKYEPFGLSYHAADGRLYYQGQKIRCFDDLYPLDQSSQAGTSNHFPDGEVDVYALRDLSGPIERNADGSFDPSGVLLGLKARTQAEFDAYTAELGASDAAYATNAVAQSGSGNDNSAEVCYWWTAEEFEKWLEKEKKELQSLVDTGARSYTSTDGWFTWTQERVDETIARYEEILEQIGSGWHFYMDDEVGIMGLNPPVQSGDDDSSLVRMP